MTDFYIQWHITDKCNLRCIHCYGDRFDSSRGLDINRLKQIADSLNATMNIWNRKLTISLTGGEPFLKPELYEFIEYLDKIDRIQSLNIISNGTVINENVLSLKNSVTKFDTMLISLDGMTADTNDKIRGKNAYNTVIKNIDVLKMAGYKIILMYTLLSSNINEADRIYEFCVKHEIDGFIIERFIPLGQSKSRKDTELVSDTEIIRVYKTIYSQCNAEFNDRDIDVYRSLKVLLTDKTGDLLSGALCVAGNDGIGLLPDGTVLPCRRFYLPVGNILTEPLHEIWKNSEVLKKIRTEKPQSGCYALNLSLTGNYL